MVERIGTVPVPQTPQELDWAIERYRSGNWTGEELFMHWQAIRIAALTQTPVEKDAIAGEDSY